MKWHEWLLCFVQAIPFTIVGLLFIGCFGAGLNYLFLIVGVLNSKQIAFWICVCLVAFLYLYNVYKCNQSLFDDKLLKERDVLKSMEMELKNKSESLDKDKSHFDLHVKNTNDYLNNKKLAVLQLLSSKSPFKESAALRVDMELCLFKDSEDYLRNKRRPAPSAANEVKIMRNQLRNAFAKYKEMEYKYQFLLQSFPELKQYIEDDQELLSLSELKSYQQLIDCRDKRQDYLSKDEYSSLTESEKSQLALDRYINGKKSRWQIGRDYEMSCAFELQKHGYTVEMHGIKYGVEDLGRDLIAHSGFGGVFGNKVLVIQCKNWNHERVIRENVIMQLYGSTVAYAIEYKRTLNTDIIAVLMIPQYARLSPTAEAFADKLEIKIIRQNIIEYPRIKCNINNGNKIYHLPFDQQYDRAEIKNKGECYAYTIKEAENLGFRRAYRHNW